MQFIIRNKVLSFAIFSGFLLILLQVLRWEIFNLISIFGLIIELSIWCLFIISLIASLIYFFRKREKEINHFGPLLINFIILLITIFIPFNSFLINYDFSTNKKEREKVIQLVNSGTLKPNVSHNGKLIHLPEEYKGISKGGGDIVINKTKEGTAVFFYTFRGILDNFSGFSYCPNSNIDCTDLYVSENDKLESKKLNDHWYWLASH